MKKIFIDLLCIYKKFFSPFFEQKGIKCKYYPSCSEYCKQAVEKYGIIKGVFYGVKRIVRCNPFSKGGYDPVP